MALLGLCYLAELLLGCPPEPLLHVPWQLWIMQKQLDEHAVHHWLAPSTAQSGVLPPLRQRPGDTAHR